MSLSVLLRGELVGTLVEGVTPDYTFTYESALVDDVAAADSLVLSCSLPLRQERFEPMEARPFFEGLLPEGSQRERISRVLPNTDPGHTYRLLEQLGRDCAGAVVIVPEGEESSERAESIRWMTEEDVGKLIEELPARPLGVSPDREHMRLSLAGVQSKAILVRNSAGQFGEPREGTPSTHILKPQYPAGDYEDLVFNERFCLRVAECVGLPVTHSELLELADFPVLLLERFDRSTDGQLTLRLHQEDLCQALGRTPTMKYEEHGGPGFGDIAGLLRALGRGADVIPLAQIAVVNFVLGNSDAHAKNFALLYGKEGVRLAPFYDLVSTAAYPGLDTTMAMQIGDTFAPEGVNLRSWIEMSDDCGLQARQFLDLVRATAERTARCVEHIAEEARSAGWHRPVLDGVADTAERRVQQIQQEIE